MIPAVLCLSSLLDAPLSLLSHSRSSRNNTFSFFPKPVCVHMNRGLHTARSLSSISLILITCGHMTALLSNQTGHMMEFSLSFSVNMKFMSAGESGWHLTSHKAQEDEVNPLCSSEGIQEGRRGVWHANILQPGAVPAWMPWGQPRKELNQPAKVSQQDTIPDASLCWQF